jgi:oligopeptide transport system permease protein
MLPFLIKRVLTGFFVYIVILTITFFLVRLTPGDPFASEKAMPESVREVWKQKYGMDKPLHIQYLNFMKGAIIFDFGRSTTIKHMDVWEMIALGFPVSAFLGFLALTFATFIGTTLGALSAAKRYTPIDYLTIAVVVIGICIPSFVIAPVMVVIFSFTLLLFPPAGWGGFSEMILPAFVLSLPYIAYISRLTRSGVIEAMQQDYIRTARAKGLPERRVVFVHALRNGIIPVVTFLGPAAAGIMVGSFVVELIFHIPGMGKYFVTAFLNKDYNLMIADVAVYSLLLIIFNLLVDITYRFIDPRIRLQ